ncbi:MAG: hypothetical protein H0V07_12280 [Propionibacteriales bacterium]|nr:hypothetical protein [Propionibacteriales bacterium]
MREAALKEHEQYLPRIAAAKGHIAKGDKLAAIQALFPDEDLMTDLFWDLAKLNGQQVEAGDEDGSVKRMTPDQIADLAATKLEIKRAAAEQEAAAAAALAKAEQAAAGDRELEGARTEYLGDVNQAFQAGGQGRFAGIEALHRHLSSDVEPGLDANDPEHPSNVIGRRLMKFVETEGRKLGRILPPAEALAAYDARLRAGMPATPVAEVRPSPTMTSAWRSDPGRPTPADDGHKTLDRIREERRAALRGRPTG